MAVPPNPSPPLPPASRRPIGATHRIGGVVGVLVLAAIVVVSGGAGALAAPAPTPSKVEVGQVSSDISTATSTSEALAGTTLEADANDGGGPMAPWLIWSGLAAGATVLVGGLVLKRRMT